MYYLRKKTLTHSFYSWTLIGSTVLFLEKYMDSGICSLRQRIWVNLELCKKARMILILLNKIINFELRDCVKQGGKRLRYGMEICDEIRIWCLRRQAPYFWPLFVCAWRTYKPWSYIRATSSRPRFSPDPGSATSSVNEDRYPTSLVLLD